MMNLHRVKEWEEVKPSDVEFLHFFYKPGTLMIRKVIGIIKVMKSISPENGGERKTVNCVHKVFWDGYGRCYKAKSKTRHRNGDIHFKIDVVI